MSLDFQKQFTETRPLADEDFEKEIQLATDFLRRRKTRFFLKRGTEFIERSGVVMPVTEALRLARQTATLQPLHSFESAKYQALCQFIEEEREFLAEKNVFDGEINPEPLLKKIKQANNPSEKVDLIKKTIEDEGADLILQHFFEFNLSPQQEREIFLVIADKDPEIIIHNIAHIDINDYGRKEILDLLFSKEPVQTMSCARELNLSEYELDNYLGRFVLESPLTFLGTIRFILRKHSFSAEIISNWEKKLTEFISNLEQPTDILSSVGNIEVFDIFPKLQEVIDLKIRGAIKQLGVDLYDQLVASKNKMGETFSIIDFRNESGKIIESWGCSDYADEILLFASWQNEHAGEKSSHDETDCAIPGYYFPFADEGNKLKSNAKFLIVEESSRELARGKELVDDLGWLIEQSEKSYNNAILEKLFEQLFARNNVAETAAILLDIVVALPISRQEKNERFKKIIDQDPVAFARYFLKRIYDVLDEDVRLYFMQRLAEENPFCLAENYAKFPMHNHVREEQFFKKLIAAGVQPFSRIKDVQILMPLLRVESLGFLWGDGGNPRVERAKNNLLEAREFLSEKTWNLLLLLEQRGESWGLEKFYEGMTREGYEAMDAIVERRGVLYEYLFEEGESTDDGRKKRSYERLKLLTFLRKEDLGRWESLVIEMQKYSAQQEKERKKNERKRKEKEQQEAAGNVRRVFKQRSIENLDCGAQKLYGDAQIEVLLIARSFNLSIVEAIAIRKQWEDLIDVQTFSPDIDPRRQIEFLIKNKDRINRFLENDLVATEKKRLVRLILTAESPERKLIFLENFANNLDCPIPVWEQMAVLSKALLLEEMSEKIFIRQVIPLARDSYMWQGFSDVERARLIGAGTERDGLIWIAGAEFTPEQIKTLIQNRLQKTLAPDRSSLQATSLRNKNFAEAQCDNLILPLGTLLHFSDSDSVGEILRMGNLCGECLGVKSQPDAYPYHVDTLRVQENVGDRDIASVLKTRLNYGLDILYVYPFRENTDSFHHGEELPVESGHFNHHLFFGSLPRTELGGIVLNLSTAKKKERGKEILEYLKSEIVKNDIYIPVFDTDGKLLFTFEEFSFLLENQKPCESVDHFLFDNSYLDHLDISGGGGHAHTVKEHSLLVEQKVSAGFADANISPRLQTVLRLAARLHDSGKASVDADIQEISNVIAAKELLGKIRFLKIEDERLVLKFVRNDEMLGEILKEMNFEFGKWHLSKEGRDKLKKFKEIFTDEEERRAILLLYQSDVRSIGGQEYNQWMVEEKLKELKLI